MRGKRRRRRRHQRKERTHLVKLFGAYTRLRRMSVTILSYREPALGHLDLGVGWFRNKGSP